MVKFIIPNNIIQKNNIEHFQQSVLLSIPLSGTYNPNIKSGPTTSSSSNGQAEADSSSPTLPIITHSYVLRSYKKPVQSIPLKNSDVDTEALKATRLAGYKTANKSAADIATAETEFLKQPLNSFSDTYNSDNMGSPDQLKAALNACTQYSTGANPCYGIVVENTDIQLPEVALKYTSHSYTYQLITKPPSNSSADSESLICDPAFYTYIKDTYAKSPDPPSCPPPKVVSRASDDDQSTNAPARTPSDVSTFKYFNAPKAAPKESLLQNKFFLIGVTIALILIVGGGSYYFMFMKKSDTDDSYKLLLKKKGGYFFFI